MFALLAGAVVPIAPAVIASVAALVVPLAAPETRMSLLKWMALRLNSFNGSGTSIQAAN